jgi:hypothetical protein
MKRLWTIIGVADVPRNLNWYLSLFGQAEETPAHSYLGQILDEDGTVLLCLHQWEAHGHPTYAGPTLPIRLVRALNSSRPLASATRFGLSWLCGARRQVAKTHACHQRHRARRTLRMRSVSSFRLLSRLIVPFLTFFTGREG